MPQGNVSGLNLVEVELVEGRFTPVPGSERTIPAQLVLLAMGFLGPEREGFLEQLEVELDERGNVKRDKSYQTSVEGVFACGDAGRGQSLIVWAIAEGRSCAAGVDTHLTGSSTLPTPSHRRPARWWSEQPRLLDEAPVAQATDGWAPAFGRRIAVQDDAARRGATIWCGQ